MMLALLLALPLASAAPDLVLRPSLMAGAGYRAFDPWLGGVGELTVGLQPGPRLGASGMIGVNPRPGGPVHPDTGEPVSERQLVHGHGLSAGWMFAPGWRTSQGPVLGWQRDYRWGDQDHWRAWTAAWTWTIGDIAQQGLTLDLRAELGLGEHVGGDTGMPGIGGAAALSWPWGLSLGLDGSMARGVVCAFAGYGPRFSFQPWPGR